MGNKLYSQITRRYAPLTKDSDDVEFSAESIDRAFGLVKQYTPQSWGGEGEERNPVFMEAIRLVNEEGLIIDPALGKPSDSHVARIAHEETHALMNSAALALVDIERENGRDFTDANIPALLMKTMQEIYTGKNKIQMKQMHLNAGWAH